SVGACSAQLPDNSNALEVVMADEIGVLPEGQLCALATFDRSPAPVRFIARGGRGSVRMSGATRMLDYLGSNMRGGGRFSDGRMTLEILDVPAEAARSTQPIGEWVRVRVSEDSSVEEFRGVWTC